MRTYKSKILLLNALFLAFFLTVNVQAQQTADSLIIALENTKNQEKRESLLKIIALNYEKMGAYNKALEYHELLLALKIEESDKEAIVDILYYIGENQLRLGKYEDAINTFDAIAKRVEKIEGIEVELKIVDILIREQKYASAIERSQKLLNAHKNNRQTLEMAQLLNTLGYLMKRVDKEKEAIAYFDEAQSINFALSANKTNNTQNQNAAVFINLGVTYTHLGKFEEAITNYEKAYQFSKETGDSTLMAELNNYTSTTYLVKGNVEEALSKVEQSISIAEQLNNKEILKDSYKILSEIRYADNDYGEGQKALKKYLALKEELEKEEDALRKEQLQRQIDAERNENIVKQSIAKQREQELALKQARLEAEKKEQALTLQQRQLELLKRDKELQRSKLDNQRLEKQRIQQTLAIANQNLERAKREKEYAQLQQQREIEKKEQELKQAEQQRQLDKIESEKAIQAQKISNKERNERYYLYGFIAFGVFLTLILYMLYQRNKSNGVLKKQQEEITKKNEELLTSEEEIRQHLEELKSTQELLEWQNQTIQSQFIKVTESINYAQNIQNSILPDDVDRSKMFPENFLLYQPKDIVSGDFFWYSDHENQKIVGVIDCTGHGVPGAFMSLIGNNILNELIYVKGLRKPSIILEELHKEVCNRLSHTDKKNRDGMDLGLCLFEKIDDNKVKMVYAGAKHTLYVRNGSLVELKGDRKSIGDKTFGDLKFTDHELNLSKNSMVYLTTDGFIDQANPGRSRFTTKKFKMLIENNYQKNLDKQLESFDQALKIHKDTADQRDDITLIGLRV